MASEGIWKTRAELFLGIVEEMMKVPASDIAHFLSSLAARVSSRFELHSSVMQSRQIKEIVLSAVVTFKHIFIKWSSSRNTPHTTAPPRNRSMLLVCIYGHEEKPTRRDFSSPSSTQTARWYSETKYTNAHLHSLEKMLKLEKKNTRDDSLSQSLGIICSLLVFHLQKRHFCFKKWIQLGTFHL